MKREGWTASESLTGSVLTPKNIVEGVSGLCSGAVLQITQGSWERKSSSSGSVPSPLLTPGVSLSEGTAWPGGVAGGDLAGVWGPGYPAREPRASSP